MAKKTIEEKYKKISQREHVILRPDTYVGSTSVENIETWVYGDNDQIVKKEVNYIPAFLKIFDEAITNASDHAHRKGTNVKNIKIDISDDLSKIKVWNDGTSIPVEIHKTEKIYVPELIFGHLLTGSNYDDTEERTGAGRNGLGIKLTNIFSDKFIIDLCDGKKNYKQTFTNNLTKIGKPIIKDSNSSSYTSISYEYDSTKFVMSESVKKNTLELFKKRVYDLAAFNSKINVYLNKKKIDIKSIDDWIKLHISKDTEYYIDSTNKDWIIAFAESSTDKFEQSSIVNGNTTWLGGTHVNNISNQLVNELSDILKKGKKDIKISSSDIRNKFHMFIICTIPNPIFNSQTKETLSMRLPFTPILSKKIIKDLSKSDIMTSIRDYIELREQQRLTKLNVRAAGKTIKIDKLIDAHSAGTSESEKCYLLITEGDSALGSAVAGMAVVNRKYWGAFPIRGRFINVRETSVSKIMDNQEVKDLLKILGLVPGKKYRSLSELRYGKVVFFTDADDFGSAIKGLLLNFIHYMFPELLELGFCYEFITPIIKATKGKVIKEYYDLDKYKKDKSKLDGYKIKYYKGLGTNTPSEMKEMFKDIENHLIQFKYNPETDSDKIDMLFNKKKADDRKDWMIKNIDFEVPVKKKVNPISSFIDNEYIQFSNYDNIISIPAFEDGFKPSQRKIFYATLKKNIKDELKVAQLGGYVAENTEYAHGETNLYETIINMSQNFVGSNNINYLEPIGNFGNRRDPKSAASARYIFTNINDIIRYVFRKEDDIILEQKIEEGYLIEPEYYYPIIPMILINGAKGIGTGWSTFIPQYSPNDIINKIKLILRNPKGGFNLHPSYNNWKGEIIKVDNETYNSKGVYKLTKNTLVITELPIDISTDNYTKHLNDLYDKKVIKNYIDNSTDEIIDIKITFDKVPSDLEKKLKLISNIKLTNMHTFRNNEIIKWDSSEDMLREWVNWRIKFYEKRKKMYLEQLEKKLNYMDNYVRFIKSIIEDKLKINNRKKNLIVNDLIKMKFDMIDDSYSYLLNIPIYNLTKEKYDEMVNNMKDHKKYISDYKKIKPTDLWITELDELKKKL